MKKTFQKEGYTIVELIVAMSVFIVLLTVSVGSFVQALRSERKLVALMTINNNAGIVIEQMAREIRTGYAFCDTANHNYADLLGKLLPCGTASLSFINYKGIGVNYNFSDGAISRTETTTLEPAAMTAGDVEVNNIVITLSQVDSGDATICNPWRATITMEVGSKNPAVTETTSLETTVSSRVLPVEAPGVSQDVLNKCRLH